MLYVFIQCKCGCLNRVENSDMDITHCSECGNDLQLKQGHYTLKWSEFGNRLILVPVA